MVSAKIAQNQKWHLFFEKGVLLTWVKKWVLLTVFLKSCVFLKTLFYSVFSKTQLFKSKNGMLKKIKKLWKIVGCFWTWQNGVFWVCVFEVLMLLWFVFGVFGIVPEVLKCLFFSQFFGLLWGGLFLFIFGFGRFRCFCVSCVCFCFLCCFCFCFVCFVFVLLLDCFLVFVLVLLLILFIIFLFVFLFLFFFVFFWFFFVFVVLFFGGFKGQVRWPKGPPHLALNPPYFFWFCFFCFVFCCFVFWRV